ncbi:bacterioferritin-associated ferredoxin [Methyloceanibacter sp.]|uniref:(2Fe-2S)-binding protein n=1 Tax=Methyloceanibacter sp. TaxID=1965321 RepID=UPI00351ADE04
MIVCSCTMITSDEIAEAVTELRTEDPLVVLTPGLIYRRLGKRPSCGNCLPLVTELMVAHDEDGPGSAASSVHRTRTPSLRAKNRP